MYVRVVGSEESVAIAKGLYFYECPFFAMAATARRCTERLFFGRTARPGLKVFSSCCFAVTFIVADLRLHAEHQ